MNRQRRTVTITLIGGTVVALSWFVMVDSSTEVPVQRSAQQSTSDMNVTPHQTGASAGTLREPAAELAQALNSESASSVPLPERADDSSFSVSVVDRNEIPISTAWAQAIYEGQVRTANESGSCIDIANLPLDVSFIVSVGAPGYRSVTFPHKISSRRSEPRVVILEGEIGIEGAVLHRGQPIAGATVRVCWPEGDGDVAGWAKTDENGRFVVDVLKEAEFRVLARKLDIGTGFSFARSQKWGQRSDLLIELRGAGGVSGWILDEEGAPLAGARLVGLHDLGWAASRPSREEIHHRQRSLAFHERDDGLLQFVSETEADGSFQVLGLKQGSFLVLSDEVHTYGKELGVCVVGGPACTFHLRRPILYLRIKLRGDLDPHGTMISLVAQKVAGPGPSLVTLQQSYDRDRGFLLELTRGAEVEVRVSGEGVGGKLKLNTNELHSGQVVDVPIESP